MNYKVAIDPAFGGSESGNVGSIIEKDYNLLISNYIKERLDSLGIPNIITRNTDRYLSDNERKQIIESAFGNDSNVIVLSNRLNKGSDGNVEIVYSIKDNDSLANAIYKNMEEAGFLVSKYYQLRDQNNTSQDYYPIIKNNTKYKPIIVFYGDVNNANDVNNIKNNYQKYAEAVVKAITEYIKVPYTPIGDNYYVVKKGDSLWKIATSYNISVDELKTANSLTSNLLNIGQVLYIPKKGSDNNNSSNNIYTVKKGDSLYQIAKSYNVTVDQLKKANNLTSNLLSIGQKLIIPLSDSIYIVKKGDTLYSIALKNSTTVNKIKQDNNLTSNTLSIGQKLIIN